MNDTTSNNSGSGADEAVETVRKIYIRDLHPGERLTTVFRVAKKSRQTARNGKPFLILTLADKTGEVDARVFDRAEELEKTFNAEDYVLTFGNVIAFHGKPQVVIDRLERLDPEPIDAAEFAYTRPPEPAKPEQREPREGREPREPREGREAKIERAEGEERASVAQICEMVERVQDPNVKALLLAFLDDPAIAAGLPTAPAAKGIHHAYRGGLADHLASVMRLAMRVADHYPMADRDLILAGALLHDIGKVEEISPDKGFDYTDAGRLVGHLVLTAQKIHEKAQAIPNFPPLLEHHLTHIVLAHHGQLEYGSPKVPVTLEAYIVHMVDSLDSRIASWLEAMGRDQHERWTDVVRPYDRHLWKGPSPTVRAKSPVERRRPRDEKKKGPKPQEGAREAGKKERAEKPREAAAPKLSFKPLADLAPSSGGQNAQAESSAEPVAEPVTESTADTAETGKETPSTSGE